MIGMNTPYEILREMIRAAMADTETPEGGVGILRGVRAKLHARGLLHMHMSASAIEALIDETIDTIQAAEEAERRHVASFESH